MKKESEREKGRKIMRNDWSEEGIRHYHKNCESWRAESKDVENIWREIKEKMERLIKKEKRKIKRELGERKWHSKEWRKKKRDLRKEMRKLKRGAISTEECINRRKNAESSAKRKGRDTKGRRKKR